MQGPLRKVLRVGPPLFESGNPTAYLECGHRIEGPAYQRLRSIERNLPKRMRCIGCAPDEFVREVTVLECTCGRCGATWVTRSKAVPVRCAKCGSPYWNVPKKS